MPHQTISHYELLEPLGRGGMGVVHKARDLKLGRLAALKFLSPHLVDSAEARTRFLREARSLSALSHPHIATVYEVDEADGAPFLAMEYLPGGTLRLRVEAAKSAGMPVDEAKILDWGIGLAEGLAHAHSKGIVHRDVKSSNAMFDEEGRIKLTDFGLAKELTGADVSATSNVVGTVGYMSPEQISGGHVDHRSDLYSLGVVLYELATGQLPFAASTPGEMVNKILSTDPPSVGAVRPDVPPALDRVVGRLMSKDVGERYQSAQDALHDLQRIRSGTAEASLLSTRTLKLGTPARPFRGAAIGGAAVVVIVALAAGFWPKPPVLPENKHVLVLPLRSIDGDANQEVLCDGLTETLTTALTQTGLLSVVPASDARKMETVQQARREFGVNLVLSGSLQRRGDSVRLTLSLVDADKDRQLGAETIDAAAEQPFRIEEGMLAKVADLVDVAVPQADAALLAKSASATPGAFDAYLRGRGFLYRYDKEGNLDRAQQQFDDATRADPQFALAYAGLAEANLLVYRQRREKQGLVAAQTAAERALALNPELAIAHATFGAVLADSDQPDAAIVELDKAIEVDPRDPAAYRELAKVYASQKKFDRAEEVYKKAIHARPGDWRSYSNLATYYAGRQRYADAERLLRKVIDLTPDNHLGYRNLGGLYILLGRNDEAEGMLLKAWSLNPKAKTASNLGALYTFVGRYPDAVTILEKAVVLAEREAPNDYKIWGNLGDAYWLSGAPPDKASSAFRHAVEIAERLRAGKPEDADLSSVLAEYYAKLGARDQAVERIEAALSTDPKSASVHYQAGLVYAMLGEDDRARREVAEALARGIAPDQIQHAPELKPLRESGSLLSVQK
jgi:tetratricopeptide (TPR) repeat protein/tRNA A-37 threonylcarbamoyl transferase component Bud32